ncbi:MAG: EscU/YscU/HrcU family type III secretion system export apparatus switch protein [Xanthomonadales bacterium]|uniref:type III secretion system export apparatus subunit SctU n=1 Tax=Hydrogenophaga sp. TaxID=1904254 RepID=UPI00169AFE57|nr:type III secretion system export apparatus subunit SctU [Hydrogenophaga sp.]NIQ36742.1 EscU/YscU/HrcU family type III secretion system export apparatus switch protein [Xanthomonadales bacterium]NIM42010.1 EscU/YscU/HrcU family type III secretion system export apparatus switch protein [Hydrogenophaga sp.]NIN27313.1 EscU/YscU/HrcU family type III secretion system export apparatus switch protein [Hydrogenophaga sp.]NIN32014.1 EscU/YscU/HrcU family type III secretion system export apparatus swit
MSEKTEQPTDQRLRQAREEGNVAKSKDFTETVLMGGLLVYTLLAGPDIVRAMTEIMVMPGQLYGMPFRDALALLVVAVIDKSIELLLPFVGLVLFLGIGVEALQTGFNVSFKAMAPKGERIDPIKNLKQMFTMKNLVEFFKSMFKLGVLSAVVYLIIYDAIEPLSKIPLAGIGAVGLAFTDMMVLLTTWTFLAFATIAVLDFLWQRYQYTKNLMMSMEEVKQEFKQMEGDPHVKGHRKEFAKELVFGDEENATRDASVVVTNPTHLAIALYYEEGQTPLPVVLAKGEGGVAEAMKRVAEEEGIPIMRDVPLARALMSEAQVNQYIPSELIEPVANLLVTLRRMAEASNDAQAQEFDDGQ